MSSLVTLHQDTAAAPGPGLGAGTPAAGDFLTVPRTRRGEREEERGGFISHSAENVLFCVLCEYLLSDAVRGREDPLRADEGAATQVLVQGVDQGNLQATVGYSWQYSCLWLSLDVSCCPTCQHHSPGAASAPPTTRPAL